MKKEFRNWDYWKISIEDDDDEKDVKKVDKLVVKNEKNEIDEDLKIEFENIL